MCSSPPESKDKVVRAHEVLLIFGIKMESLQLEATVALKHSCKQSTSTPNLFKFLTNPSDLTILNMSLAQRQVNH